MPTQALQRLRMWTMPSLALAAACLTMLPAATGQAVDEQRPLSPAWVAQLTQPPRPLEPAADASATPAAWHPWAAAYRAGNNFTRLQLRMSAAEIATWDRQLHELLAALQRAPVLRDAHVVRLWSASGSLVAGEAPTTLAGHLMIGAWIDRQLKTRPDGRTVIDGETRHLLVDVNQVPTTPGPPWMKDEVGEFFPFERQASPWPGTTIIGRTLLSLPQGRGEPYAPVSRERVLRAFITGHAEAERRVQNTLNARRQELADYLSPANEPRRRAEVEHEMRGFMNRNRQDEATARARAEAIDRNYIDSLRRATEPPPDDPLFQEVRAVRALRDELERMPRAQRETPAWVSASLAYPWLPLLREPGSAGAVPVMQVDPAWFDRRLPRTALQMLTVSGLDEIAERAHGPRAQAGDQWTAANRANLLILQQTDWAALARAQLR